MFQIADDNRFNEVVLHRVQHGAQAVAVLQGIAAAMVKRSAANQKAVVSCFIDQVIEAVKGCLRVFRSSTDELITAYKKAVNDSDELKMQAQSDQAQIRDLEDENSDLKNQVQILKAALLSTYSSDEISAVIEQGGLKKAVTKRLDNLECLDSVQCRQVASVKDLYGTTHSVSYRFEASSDAAWAKFKLDGKYDTFTASIVTADDTNRDSNMSVEVYVDDVLVGRVDDIIRDEHVRPISVSVNGGNVLMIKLIRSTNYYSVAYISDAYLSTLQ